MFKITAYSAVLAAAIAFSPSVKAQTNKTTIGILSVTSSATSMPKNYTLGITDALTDGFVKQKRFLVVDRAKMDGLDRERNLQKSEEFIDGNVVAQGKSIGAEYLVNGNVTAYQNDGEVCKLTLSLSVTSVATGQIVESQTLNLKGGNRAKTITRVGLNALSSSPTTLKANTYAGRSYYNDESQEGKAFKLTLADVATEIDDFVSQRFPVSFKIAEISKKDKEGNAEEILIAGGNDMGLKKGDKLKIVEVKQIEVDGKKLPRNVEIGIAKISKVEDENFSSCKIVESTCNIAEKFEAKSNIKLIAF